MLFSASVRARASWLHIHRRRPGRASSRRWRGCAARGISPAAPHIQPWHPPAPAWRAPRASRLAVPAVYVRLELVYVLITVHRHLLCPVSLIASAAPAEFDLVLSPRAARLDVDRRVLRPARDVQAGVDAEAPRHQVAKAGTPGGDGFAKVVPCPARRPMKPTSAQRGVTFQRSSARRGRALVLVARDRHAAQLDERQLVERHVAARRCARRCGRRGRNLPASGKYAEGLRRDSLYSLSLPKSGE